MIDLAIKVCLEIGNLGKLPDSLSAHALCTKNCSRARTLMQRLRRTASLPRSVAVPCFWSFLTYRGGTEVLWAGRSFVHESLTGPCMVVSVAGRRRQRHTTPAHQNQLLVFEVVGSNNQSRSWSVQILSCSPALAIQRVSFPHRLLCQVPLVARRLLLRSCPANGSVCSSICLQRRYQISKNQDVRLQQNSGSLHP